MTKPLQIVSVTWSLVAATCMCAVSCSDNGGTPMTTGSGGGAGTDSGSTSTGGGGSSNTGGAGGVSPTDASDAPSYQYVLIDDMETTTHGPIQLAGIAPPLNAGYWFNAGAIIAGDSATPAIMQFVFSPLPTSMTWNGKTSTQAAHQTCSLNGQYDFCQFAFEFAQLPIADAGVTMSGGVDAAGNDAGDAAPPVPMVTVPFDVSSYKGITFWGKATAEAGSLDVKIQFPNIDTDPRGGVCNGADAGAGGPNDTSQCYNSFSIHKSFTSEWQQFTILFTQLVIENYGFQSPAPFTGKNVYGIGWQAQKNTLPAAGPVTTDFWVDDVYFIK